ncbi:MAG: hypothetical protein R3E88_01085 [Myxococcota bacterium]
MQNGAASGASGAAGTAREPEGARGEGARAVLVAWLALSALLVALFARGAGAPGMYYDEAWLARQAQLFVDPARDAAMPPGTQSVDLLGRRFPLFALPYLGALKSQLEIAPLALFGSRVGTVRGATLATALAALLATMLATRRAFGRDAAIAAGALVALDPSVFFHAQWEWGPFTTGWLCRAAGAALLLRSAQDGGRAAAVGGGLALGLSVYNRADSVLVLLAVAAGIAAFRGRDAARLVRERRADATAALGAAALGALPMIANAPRVLGTFGELRERGDLAERIRTFATTLDGSYVHRLMEQGGRFDALAAADAPSTLLGVAVALATAAALVAALVAALRARGIDGARRATDEDRLGADGERRATADRGALALACLALAAAMLALRGATRAHHMLNLAPLVHVLVASALVAAARRGRGHAALAALALAAVLASDTRSIAATRELVARTGGRGWWSDALAELGRELDAEPGASATSLDWGFHLPLAFAARPRAQGGPALDEPIWEIEPRVRATGVWATEGDGARRYVVHDAAWDRFGFGPHLLAAARALGDRAAIRAYRDREGEVAFYTVRFAGPHRLSLERGRGFRVEALSGSLAEAREAR